MFPGVGTRRPDEHEWNHSEDGKKRLLDGKKRLLDGKKRLLDGRINPRTIMVRGEHVLKGRQVKQASIPRFKCTIPRFRYKFLVFDTQFLVLMQCR